MYQSENESCLATSTGVGPSPILSSVSTAHLNLLMYSLRRRRCEDRLERIHRSARSRKSAQKVGSGSSVEQAGPKHLGTELEEKDLKGAIMRDTGGEV